MIRFKKAQIITFDLGLSIVLFIIFIALFFGLVLLVQRFDYEEERDFELEYVFLNLEYNLRAYEKANPSSNIDFLSDYHINVSKIETFYQSAYNGVIDVDQFIVGTLNGTHGIGLGYDKYDVCMFLEYDSSRLFFAGFESVGNVSSGFCHDAIITGNPCEDYKEAFTLIKPVLLDNSSVASVIQNRIVLMNLVLCEK